MPYYQGYDSSVIIGNFTVPCTKWSVNTKIDEIDVTRTSSLGFVEYQDGVADADITIEGILGNQAREDPFFFLFFRNLYSEIHIGSVAGITINISNTITPANTWSFVRCLITGWNMDNSVRDVVRWTLMAKGRHDTYNKSNPPQWTEPL